MRRIAVALVVGITLLAEEGEHIEEVSALLGHVNGARAVGEFEIGRAHV